MGGGGGVAKVTEREAKVGNVHSHFISKLHRSQNSSNGQVKTPKSCKDLLRWTLQGSTRSDPARIYSERPCKDLLRATLQGSTQSDSLQGLPQSDSASTSSGRVIACACWRMPVSRRHLFVKAHYPPQRKLVLLQGSPQSDFATM